MFSRLLHDALDGQRFRPRHPPGVGRSIACDGQGCEYDGEYEACHGFPSLSLSRIAASTIAFARSIAIVRHSLRVSSLAQSHNHEARIVKPRTRVGLPGMACETASDIAPPTHHAVRQPPSICRFANEPRERERRRAHDSAAEPVPANAASVSGSSRISHANRCSFRPACPAVTGFAAHSVRFRP